MSMHDFPGELWLMIFKYLSTEDLLHTFHSLNQHHRNLIAEHFQFNAVNLRSTSESNCHLCCSYYSSSIRKLRLCQSFDYPSQTSSFLIQHFHLNRFTSLQSLSLEHIESSTIWQEILNQINELQNLTHLCIRQLNVYNNIRTLNSMFNQLWSLPKLIYVYFDLKHSKEKSNEQFPALNTISLSLKHVELPSLTCNLNDVHIICHHTPCLEILSLNCVSLGGNQLVRHEFEWIKKLRLVFNGVWPALTNLLQCMTNLEHLTLTATLPISVDGHRWRSLISEHRPNLKVFQFVIHYKTVERQSTPVQAIRLVNSFNNAFWLTEHHWCVRCDWQRLNDPNYVCLYTLPYILDQFYECASNVLLESQTTCVQNHQSYDRVHSLNYSYFPTVLLPISFSKLNTLLLTLPIDNRFQTVIPSLNELRHIQLYIEENEIDDQRLNLLNTAPCLYKLSLKKWPSSTTRDVYERITNASIRKLDLYGMSSTNCLQCFDYKRCEALSRTTLAQQCEKLTIRLETHENIFLLLSNMRNLRLLVARCANDPCSGESEHPDRFLQQIKAQLPSTYIVFREARSFGKIRIWIQ
ncbi:unnamed protein product [Adineta ricciae]|uniref:F-box domain-containing protein n=2 Tax=Adineta ricciae TaxID=249248 RepID=A0A815X9L3_ADIRI|nr:unnamed protein product [Adineta ricciae]